MQQIRTSVLNQQVEGSNRSGPTLDDVLTRVNALLFEPAARGRTADSYLGDGVRDSGSIPLDEIGFVS